MIALAKKLTKADERGRELESLRDMIPSGSTVFGITEHVSASGMSAVIRLVIFKDGSPLWPNYGVGLVTGFSMVDKNGKTGLRVNGCGFNRLEHIVSSLAMALYGNERALKYQSL